MDRHCMTSCPPLTDAPEANVHLLVSWVAKSSVKVASFGLVRTAVALSNNPTGSVTLVGVYVMASPAVSTLNVEDWVPDFVAVNRT
ncbi:MAG: hypothetical protein LC708_03155 [Actinobacteria bacterium]|nr:hypothetical protein [Actinomycetota bacterium]